MAKVSILLVACLVCTSVPSAVDGRKSKTGKKGKRSTGGVHANGNTGQKPRVSQHGDRIRRKNAYTWAEWAESAPESGSSSLAEEFRQFGCNIERRTARTLSEEEFMADFYLQKPVLIEGAASHWNPAVFSAENLQQNYSQLPVKALQKIGDKFDHPCDGVEPIQTTLGAYYDAGLTLPPELTPQAGMPKEPWYIFDRMSMNMAETKLFPASTKLLRDEPSLPLAFLGPDVDMILSVGGAGSGTQFHRHSDGFSVLLKGHKRWFMKPGEDVPLPVFPADNIPIRLYASELFPTLEPEEQGSHCVQRTNDLMYVPEGWYHATESLDETIAVAGQSYIKGPVTKKLRLSLQITASRSQQESYDKLIQLEKFYREELQEAHHGIDGMAAMKLRDMGRHAEAYQRLEQAIALNPKHADGYTNKGQFMLLDAMNLLAQKKPESKESKQTIIDALKQAFELNPFDYMAADALALVYKVSGPGNAELVTLWQGRRDKAMSDISISMDCATKNNRLLGHAFMSLNPRTQQPYIAGMEIWHPDVV